MDSYFGMGHLEEYTSIHHVVILVLGTYYMYGSGRGCEIGSFK